jgi:hypothetical protein
MVALATGLWKESRSFHEVSRFCVEPYLFITSTTAFIRDINYYKVVKRTECFVLSTIGLKLKPVRRTVELLGALRDKGARGCDVELSFEGAC